MEPDHLKILAELKRLSNLVELLVYKKQHHKWTQKAVGKVADDKHEQLMAAQEAVGFGLPTIPHNDDHYRQKFVEIEPDGHQTDGEKRDDRLI